MATKVEVHVNKILALNSLVAQVMDQVADVTSEYFDNQYNSGGANEIQQADLNGYNSPPPTPADIAGAITLFQELNNFFQNSAVTTADYSVTVNILRNVQ